MAEEHARVIVMGPGDGQTVANPAGGGLTYKARCRQTGGALTAWESTAAPGEGSPLHLHVNEDEFTYVLEGRLRFTLRGPNQTSRPSRNRRDGSTTAPRIALVDESLSDPLGDARASKCHLQDERCS